MIKSVEPKEWNPQTSAELYETIDPEGVREIIHLKGPSTIIARLLTTRLKAVTKKENAEWKMSSLMEDKADFSRVFTFDHDFYDKGQRVCFTETFTISHSKRGTSLQTALIIYECSPVKRS